MSDEQADKAVHLPSEEVHKAMAQEIESLIERAAAALRATGAREVYVFGSAATGKPRDGSDVDLAVSGFPPAAFFRVMGAASQVLRRPLDLVDLDEDNPFTQYLKN
jgi:predicted nucleotidyltransferase